MVLFLGFLVFLAVVVVGEGCRLCFSVVFCVCEGSVIVGVPVAWCRCETGYGVYGGGLVFGLLAEVSNSNGL